jgi:hypothetical protein
LHCRPLATNAGGKDLAAKTTRGVLIVSSVGGDVDSWYFATYRTLPMNAQQFGEHKNRSQRTYRPQVEADGRRGEIEFHHEESVVPNAIAGLLHITDLTPAARYIVARHNGAKKGHTEAEIWRSRRRNTTNDLAGVRK